MDIEETRKTLLHKKFKHTPADVLVCPSENRITQSPLASHTEKRNALVKNFLTPDTEFLNEQVFSEIGLNMFNVRQEVNSNQELDDDILSDLVDFSWSSESNTESAEDKEVKFQGDEECTGPECVIDPMEIKLNRNFGRPTALERLEIYENKMKQRREHKLTPKKGRAMASKARAEKAKAKVLHILEWYLILKMAENRMSIFEAEKIKYGRRIVEGRKEIDKKMEIIKSLMNENCDKQIRVRDENEKEIVRYFFDNEISRVAEFSESEIKNKYQNYLLLIKKEDIKENYRQEMNVHSAIWKKKAHEIQKQIDTKTKQLQKKLEIYQNKKLLECLINTEKNWRQKAEATNAENSKLGENILKLVPPMEAELNRLRLHNEWLEGRIGHWDKIMPQVIEEMKRFVVYAFKDCKERDILLRSIDELKGFKEDKLEIMEFPQRPQGQNICSTKVEKEKFNWDSQEKLTLVEDLTETRRKSLGRLSDCLSQKLEQLLSRNELISVKTQLRAKSVQGRAKWKKSLREFINVYEKPFEITGASSSAGLKLDRTSEFLGGRNISIQKILNKIK